MTWTCPDCGAVFDDEQTMKDHATMTCQRRAAISHTAGHRIGAREGWTR